MGATLSQISQTPDNKKRQRRSAEKIAELVLEAERVGAAQVCRRENIAPAQLSRWKKKFLRSGIAAEVRVGLVKKKAAKFGGI
jgi:transposase-like protein